MFHRVFSTLLLACFCATVVHAEDFAPLQPRGEKLFAEYFKSKTAKLEKACLADVKTLDDWSAVREERRDQLREMLGLLPPPAKSDLKATITGTIEKDDFVVEKLHFQSLPGLYVTGNLYRPKVVEKPLPTVLYVCGHGASKKGNVSFGNKVSYQHHGAWFARNGYVCLVIDTLQMGEIEGIHHGTHRFGMWWWADRGYTPAGVEAWNCIRALDYLETRPEVDKSRFGVTGRSGGGAYSWWIAAIDERIQCAVPVAGITDLRNHVVDGCIEGHCDCMFQQNTYQWDYGQVTALVAPRALLIANTDHDTIFPLDGVYRTYSHARRIYDLHKAADKFGFNITPGEHKDTQDLQVTAFRWMNRHLKNDDAPIDKVAVKFFEPEQLRVFTELPSDQINTRIQESFLPAAAPASVPADMNTCESQLKDWRKSLESKVFRSWPQEADDLDLELAGEATKDGVHFRAYDFTSEDPIRLRLYVAHRASLEHVELAVLNVLDDAGWKEFLAAYRSDFEEALEGEELPPADEKSAENHRKMFEAFPWAMAYIAPIGVGPNALPADEKKRTQLLRRFQLLGETLGSRQAYEAGRAVEALRNVYPGKTDLWMQSRREMSVVALAAAIHHTEVKRLDLHDVPTTLENGPHFFNIGRVLGVPQLVALTAQRSQVVLYQPSEEEWEYPRKVCELLELPKKQFQIRKPVPMAEGDAEKKIEAK